MENEEMLEQTNDTENVDTQATEEFVEGIELTDTAEENSEDDNEIQEEDSKETKEVKKALTDILKENPEYQNEFNEIIQNRLRKERRIIEREQNEKLSDLERTEELLKLGMQKESIKDINSDLEIFYKDKGLEIPRKGLSDKQEKILAEAEADEIIDLGEEVIAKEADRLASKGYDNMTSSEKIIFKKLAEKLTEEKKKKEISELGLKEDILSNPEFISFSKKFDGKTSIKEIVELFNKVQPKKEFKSPGSMKSSGAKEEKTFYTSDEVDKLTKEDYRKNPNLIKIVKQSMEKW